MEKCRGYGKSEKVMIWLRMGYDFSKRLRLSFFFFAERPQSCLWFRSLKVQMIFNAHASPVTSTQPLEELTLISYGCTNLRVTEFPVLA